MLRVSRADTDSTRCGEDIGLDKNFQYVGGEVVPESVQSKDNCVAFLDDMRDMRFPRQKRIGDDADNFDRFGGLDRSIIHHE